MRLKKGFLYAAFALLATAGNLGAQKVTFAYVFDDTIWQSLAVGTAVGLAVKYVLDKLWIFDYRGESLERETRVILRYCLTGAFTTVVFLGIELMFHFYFGSEHMRLLGGAIGLVIGYTLKYYADRELVFRRGREGPPPHARL